MAAQTEDSAATVPGPFAKGSRAWSVAGAASLDASYGWLYFTRVAGSYSIADGLALTCGGMFGYADDTTRMPEGVIGGPELGMRWHVARQARWSVYLDGAVGVAFQQRPLSQDSLRYNFALQSGGGAAYRLSHTLLALGGLRWHHLSNAGIRGAAHNLGYDGPSVYLELMRSF